jgi:hypothetical protein
VVSQRPENPHSPPPDDDTFSPPTPPAASNRASPRNRNSSTSLFVGENEDDDDEILVNAPAEPLIVKGSTALTYPSHVLHRLSLNNMDDGLTRARAIKAQIENNPTRSRSRAPPPTTTRRTRKSRRYGLIKTRAGPKSLATST